ncbi:MAG: flagellar motor protein MotB [Candidatus Margulisiibacteriota bacterium]
MGKMHTEIENFYVSYSDMVTLLLIFFVWLSSISDFDPVKYIEATTSIKNELSGGHPPKDVTGKLKVSNAIKEIELQEKKLEEMKKKINTFIAENHLENDITVSYKKGQLELNLGESVLFDLGSADLKPAASPILHKIASLLDQNDSLISVEGHTDNLPINTGQFPSNWELSAERACSVTRFLIRADVEPERFTVIGRSEFSPLLPNTTPQNKAKNRRVKILLKVDVDKIVKKDKSNSEAQSSETPNKE